MKTFFSGCINELHNITWPTRRQATHSMIIVLLVVLLTGVLLGVLDYLLNGAILRILS